LYGRRPVAPPPPLPLCRGLATAVGYEAEIKKTTGNESQPETEKGENRGGEGPRSGRRKLLRNEETDPFAAKGRAPWRLTWPGGLILGRAFCLWFGVGRGYFNTPMGYVPVRAQFYPRQAAMRTVTHAVFLSLSFLRAREDRGETGRGLLDWGGPAGGVWLGRR
jgi:hypothetical protein